MLTMNEERPAKRLLDCMRDVLRIQHYSIRTGNVYVEWNRRFILFHQERHPKERVFLKLKPSLLSSFNIYGWGGVYDFVGFWVERCNSKIIKFGL